ncbi:MAG: hypothetical protein EDX89_18490 [Acidobacteria bacterium]|nr:MAG: hypothetical protein EDX89_18490 [Acidobacteriota bacterium]
MAILGAACGKRPDTVPEGGAAGGFRATLKDAGDPLVLRPGATTTRPVTIRNVSPVPFPADGRVDSPKAVNVSYHWLDAAGKVVVFDGARTALPAPLGPGEAVTLDLKVVAPERQGSYVLEIDLVQEGVAWFAALGSETLRKPARVE